MPLNVCHLSMCDAGPMYDPVHKLYHNFYQIHIAEDMNGDLNFAVPGNARHSSHDQK